MVSSVGSLANAGKTAVDTSITTGGPSAGGNLLSNQKDAKEASTEAKFGEVWKQIQSKYGAKAEKPREIKKVLGKDDFLRIMITQMKNQDPTSPFKAEQMATEMAQFTSVEQLQNLNQKMEKMGTQNQPLERMAMTGLIGKKVTVDRERFPHTEGENDSLSYALPKDAKSVHIDIVSEKGETVLTKDLGPQKAGENSFSWDGKKGNTLPAKTGSYMFRISAKDENGMSLPTAPKGTATVIGVSFEGHDPVLLVGNPSAPDKVLLRNVVRIEDGIPQSIPGAQSLAQAAAGARTGAPSEAPGAMMPPNLFTFTKGEGSKNIDPSSLPPEALATLARLQAGKAAAQAQAAGSHAPHGAEPAQGHAASPPTPGFPNGLNDGMDEPMSETQRQAALQPARVAEANSPGAEGAAR